MSAATPSPTRLIPIRTERLELVSMSVTVWDEEDGEEIVFELRL